MVLSFLLFCVYLFYTLLVIFSSISTPASHFLVGLIFVWITWITFSLGCWRRKKYVPPSLNISLYFQRYFFLLSLLMIPISIYAAYFYTGSGLGDILSSFRQGSSNYNEYQRYFMENSLHVFSEKKILAILSLFLMKITLVCYFILCVFSRSNWYLWVGLIITGCSYVYFSLARGTSFELFEILLLVVYSFFMSWKGKKIGANSFLKVTVTLLVVIVSIIFFYNNISLRYGGQLADLCTSQVLCYSSDSLLSNISPALAYLSVKLSAYFAFGIYYVSYFFEYFLSESNYGLFYILIPLNNLFFNIEPEFLCAKDVDCGASWVPYSLNMFLLLGVILYFITIFLIGRTSQWLTCLLSSSNRLEPVCALSLQYFIFMFMVSLPVGNFLVGSSANILSSLFLLVCIICRRLLSNQKKIRV